MGVLDELRAGRWDEVFDLTVRTITAVVRARRLPAPMGARQWTEEDVLEVAGEFFTAGAGPSRIMQLGIRATDDRHFKHLLDQKVKQFLTDRARRDPLPRLQRTVRTNLEAMEDVMVAGTIAALRTRATAPPWAAGDDALLVAANEVEIGPAPYGPDAGQEGPLTDQASLRAVCRAVLGRADGPVELTTLTRVVGRRLGARPRVHDELDLEAHEGTRPVGTGPGPPSPSAQMLATAIWEQLDDDEKELVTYLGLGGRTASQETDIGLGRSATHDRLKKLKATMATLLDGVDDRAEVLRALVDLHAGWKEGGPDR